MSYAEFGSAAALWGRVRTTTVVKLRIGPLPDDRPVKRTITFTAALDALP